ERLNTHVHQTAYGRWRIVGVQRRKDKVTGERCLYRDFCGFEVSDLADEDDVRVLAQERAQRRSEVKSDRLLHLNLIDARQVEFDRVLGGHDVCFRLIEALQRRVQRRSLSRSGRARDQYHSEWLVNVAREFFEARRLKTELCHVEPQVLLIEE